MKKEIKYCPKCKISFPATTEYFYRSNSRHDGLSGHCKECARAYGRQYRQNNNMTEYDKKNNNKRKEYLKQFNQKYRHQHAKYEKYSQIGDFILHETIRRDQENQDLLQVRCKNCGKWFNPIEWKTRNRLQVLRGKLKGNSFLFCNECIELFKKSTAMQGKKKLCLGCQDFFPATTEYFHKNPSTKDKLAKRCKKCISEQKKKYYKQKKKG